MNSKTLREAAQKLASNGASLALIIPGDNFIAFEDFDFSINSNAPDCIILYNNSSAFACIDLRSVVGVRTLT